MTFVGGNPIIINRKQIGYIDFISIVLSGGKTMEKILSRGEALEKLLKSYEAYFDIETYEKEKEEGIPLKAHCRLFVHSEKYVLIKKAKLWDADSNEFVYIFSLPHLTKEWYERCKNYAYEEGMKLINPRPGHMYSYITAVFLCDTCTAEAKKAVCRCRIYKSFRFSWYGWMDFHTAAIVLEQGEVLTNRSGRNNAKFMKNLCSI